MKPKWAFRGRNNGTCGGQPQDKDVPPHTPHYIHLLYIQLVKRVLLIASKQRHTASGKHTCRILGTALRLVGQTAPPCSWWRSEWTPTWWRHKRICASRRRGSAVWCCASPARSGNSLVSSCKFKHERGVTTCNNWSSVQVILNATSVTPHCSRSWRQQQCTHCTCSHGHGDAGDKGQVVARVHAVPHGRQQESGGGGVDRTALVAHPEEGDTQHLSPELVCLPLTTL